MYQQEQQFFKRIINNFLVYYIQDFIKYPKFELSPGDVFRLLITALSFS